MAYSDYKHCSKCECKVYYDADVKYPKNFHQETLCENCIDQWEIIIQEKKYEHGWR